MISYKLVENCHDTQKFIDRIIKYNQRGFQLLVPHSFDEQYLLDAIKLQQHGNYNNDQDIDSDSYDGFMLNNDTLNVRNKFIDLLKQISL